VQAKEQCDGGEGCSSECQQTGAVVSTSSMTLSAAITPLVVIQTSFPNVSITPQLVLPTLPSLTITPQVEIPTLPNLTITPQIASHTLSSITGSISVIGEVNSALNTSIPAAASSAIQPIFTNVTASHATLTTAISLTPLTTDTVGTPFVPPTSHVTVTITPSGAVSSGAGAIGFGGVQTSAGTRRRELPKMRQVSRISDIPRMELLVEVALLLAKFVAHLWML
jgi:hypothetical protein